MASREENLHRTYLRMTRQGRSVVLRVRPAGWLACLLSMSLLFLGADPTRSLAYQLFALIFAFISVASISTMFFRVRGEANRSVSATAIPGEPLHVEIEVRNLGRRAWKNVRLLEIPPAPAPTVEEFSRQTEPGEKKRNFFDRYFIFYRFSWLGERRQTFHVSASEIFDLAPGGSTKVRIRLLPLRRGSLELRDLRLAKDDLFGFFRRVRPIDAPVVRVAILPRPLRLAALPSAGAAAKPSPAGASPGHRAGQSDEFLTLREYRPGDAMQHIHWAAFARAGIPIVREFEDIHQPRAALIFDSLVGDEGDAMEVTKAFELAVRVAASLAGRLRQGETLLELLLVQGRAHSFTGGPGHLQMRRLLEILASVHPETRGSFESLERLSLAYAPVCGSAHFITTHWDENRERLLERLRARGLDVKAVLTPPAKPAREWTDLPAWVTVLHAHEIERLELEQHADEPATEEEAVTA
ncbi:MAG: DUF58 domain-containing protein [Verrucomicrobiales bacterium]